MHILFFCGHRLTVGLQCMVGLSLPYQPPPSSQPPPTAAAVLFAFPYCLYLCRTKDSYIDGWLLLFPTNSSVIVSLLAQPSGKAMAPVNQDMQCFRRLGGVAAADPLSWWIGGTQSHGHLLKFFPMGHHCGDLMHPPIGPVPVPPIVAGDDNKNSGKGQMVHHYSTVASCQSLSSEYQGHSELEPGPSLVFANYPNIEQYSRAFLQIMRLKQVDLVAATKAKAWLLILLLAKCPCLLGLWEQVVCTLMEVSITCRLSVHLLLCPPW